MRYALLSLASLAVFAGCHYKRNQYQEIVDITDCYLDKPLRAELKFYGEKTLPDSVAKRYSHFVKMAFRGHQLV